MMDNTNCKKCRLWKTRKKRVIGRGAIPAEILFVGEGPGTVEDTIGKPFAGPAGRVLDQTIYRVEHMLNRRFPLYYLTNLVQCRPCDFVNGPNRIPLQDEIEACNQNLENVAAEAQPKVIITLGKTAEKYVNKTYYSYHMVHPAYILRQGGMRSPGFLSYCRELADIIEKEFSK